MSVNLCNEWMSKDRWLEKPIQQKKQNILSCPTRLHLEIRIAGWCGQHKQLAPDSMHACQDIFLYTIYMPQRWDDMGTSRKRYCRLMRDRNLKFGLSTNKLIFFSAQNLKSIEPSYLANCFINSFNSNLQMNIY